MIVVGASLEARDEALDSLLTQLLIGGPLALLLVVARRLCARRSSAPSGRVDAPRGGGGVGVRARPAAAGPACAATRSGGSARR